VLRAVLSALDAASVSVAYVPIPTLSPSEFLEFVLPQLGLPNLASTNKAERLLMLERFLLGAHDDDRTVVLVVDEAHMLGKDLLEEIRLLTNFDSRQGSLIQMVLAGLPRLDDQLRDVDMKQFKQRIAFRFFLKGLDQADVHKYIAHRWMRAGGVSAPPFDEEAIRGIALYSRGIPRLINAICDNALMMAFADSALAVHSKAVYDAARALDLTGGGHALPANGDGEAGTADDDASLELLAVAATAAGDSMLPELARHSRAAPKESWLVRSVRKLLAARQPTASGEEDLGRQGEPPG